MSEPAHDEELLVDQNDTALLTFLMNLLILQNRQKKHNSWNGIRKIKMLVVSCPKVNHLGG
jgi:hypothetical protein